MTQRNLLKIRRMEVIQAYIDNLESEYVTQRNVLKKVQKELTERQLIILKILLSDNSITLDQMPKRIYSGTQGGTQGGT